MGFLLNPAAIFYVLSPIVCIFLFQMGVVLLANGTDELLNPRIRIN
jgi:peptide/nickel transport system permease protein